MWRTLKTLIWIFIYLTYCLLLQRLYVLFNFMRGFYFILYMSWNYMIGIVTRLWAGQLRYCGSIPSKVWDFPFLQSIKTGSESDLAFCSRILGAFSPEVMLLEHEAGHWLPSGAKAKHMGRHTATLPYPLMVYRDNFIHRVRKRLYPYFYFFFYVPSVWRVV